MNLLKRLRTTGHYAWPTDDMRFFSENLHIGVYARIYIYNIKIYSYEIISSFKFDFRDFALWQFIVVRRKQAKSGYRST